MDLPIARRPVTALGRYATLPARTLALRLMAHQARTGTISAMTSLSRHQREALRQRWGITEDTRRRGPSPSSLGRFTQLSASAQRRPTSLLVSGGFMGYFRSEVSQVSRDESC